MVSKLKHRKVVLVPEKGQKTKYDYTSASVPTRGYLSKKISPVYLFHILEIFLVLYDCRKFK